MKMMNETGINTSNWKPVNITSIFNVEYGNKFDKCNMIETDKRDIAFITRTGSNNGVGAYVEFIEDINPYPAGCLTIALGGSLGSTFLQPKPFYTAQNIAVLIPKDNIDVEWTETIKLFLASLIQRESGVRYVAFGRELNTHIKNDFFISLPHNSSNQIDWDEIKCICSGLYFSHIDSSPINRRIVLDISTWHKFKINDLFPKKCRERGKIHSSEDLPEGDDFYYIGAKKKNNGVMSKCGYDPNLITKGNCIVFICNGQGSVGYALYMDRDFFASGDLVIGYNPNINVYTGLFLVSVLDKERFKYSFGRKYGKYLASTEILLPSKDGKNPDWEFMERFIKGLPYSKALGTFN